MKKNILIGVFALIILCVVSSCKKFLDVVPDNVATIDNAFTMRSQAEKFLFTCFSYMPKDGDQGGYDSFDPVDPATLGGDELWVNPAWYSFNNGFFNVAKGFQNVVNPYGDKWGSLFRAIRDCNIFLENIDKVPDVMEMEKRRWIAEVKFLKAYYNFYLVKMYGPIPLMKDNLPINANGEQIRIFRAPVDSCFNYIVQLINEAEPYLPLTIENPADELGRITQPIALSLKAKVLVYAASPLFNGNTDEAGLENSDGTQLFNQTFSKAKWDSAAIACKRAIDFCQQAGMKLYYQPLNPQFDLSDTIITQLSIRNSVCERWNSGIIWANTQAYSIGIQYLITPFIDPSYMAETQTKGQLSPPLKIAEMFYSENGVPISEDRTWDYTKRFSLQIAGDKDKLYIRKGETSAHLNFDREPRFYADLGFDVGIWYGQGRYDDKKYLDLFYLKGKYGQRNSNGNPGTGTVTGYYIKKLVHYQNVIGVTNYSITSYPFPIMRLSDLYLLYAEALNESEGPDVPDVHKYINLVRQAVGLQSVQLSWSEYSINPTKYATKGGMSDIIHRERLIELAFEGQRFWDLRRWKEATKELNMPIKGWDLKQESASNYYRPTVIFNQTFGLKDYFWPISDGTLNKNGNLVQNLGW